MRFERAALEATKVGPAAKAIERVIEGIAIKICGGWSWWSGKRVVGSGEWVSRWVKRMVGRIASGTYMGDIGGRDERWFPSRWLRRTA